MKAQRHLGECSLDRREGTSVSTSVSTVGRAVGTAGRKFSELEIFLVLWPSFILASSHKGLGHLSPSGFLLSFSFYTDVQKLYMKV